MGLQVGYGNLTNPAYLVKNGANGVTISECFSANSPYYSSKTGFPPGFWWNFWTNRTNQALAKLALQNKNVRMTVWMSIGLNDANLGTTDAYFFTMMQAFKSDWRALYGQDVTFIYTKFYTGQRYNPILDEMSQVDKKTFVVEPTMTTYDLSGGTHWDYTGFKILVARFVAMMKRILKSI